MIINIPPRSVVSLTLSLAVAAISLLTLSGCEQRPTCTDDNCTKFTVLHTNDNHGRFGRIKREKPEWLLVLR